MMKNESESEKGILMVENLKVQLSLIKNELTQLIINTAIIIIQQL